MKFKPGDIIDDRYETLAVLAETPTSIVYKAKEKNLGRLVAIKTPKPEFLQIREFMSRFKREAKLIARLNHSGVVQLLGLRESGDFAYMALEFFEGVELGDYIQFPPPSLTVGEALNILARASEALAHAHERGVIHRDVRPENILVAPMSRGGHRVKLIDFDLARASDMESLPPEMAEITSMNATVGTPSYLSPEQAQGEKVSAQSDIYSLACVYYYCFTMHLVFTGSVFSVISQHVKKEPESPSVRNPLLPKEFSQIVLRGLAKKPEDRWPTAVEMARAIQTAMRPLADKPFAELVPETTPRERPELIPAPSFVGPGPRGLSQEMPAAPAASANPAAAPLARPPMQRDPSATGGLSPMQRDPSATGGLSPMQRDPSATGGLSPMQRDPSATGGLSQQTPPPPPASGAPLFPKRKSRETPAGGAAPSLGAPAGPGLPRRPASRMDASPPTPPKPGLTPSRAAGAAAGAKGKAEEEFISRQQGKTSAQALLKRIAQTSLSKIPILAPVFNSPAYIRQACEETGRDVDMTFAEVGWVLRLLSEEEVKTTVEEVLHSLKATQTMARMSPHDKTEFRRLLLALPAHPELFPETTASGARRR